MSEQAGPDDVDPRVPEALRSATPAAAPADDAEPLRACVLATIALLTWVIGPAVVAVMAGLGVAAYLPLRHRRDPTRCLLRDVRLVLAYLMVLGAAATATTVFGLLS